MSWMEWILRMLGGALTLFFLVWVSWQYGKAFRRVPGDKKDDGQLPPLC